MSIEVMTHLSPRIITVPEADGDAISCQQLVNQAREWEDDIWNLVFREIMTATGKQSLGGGVLVGITAQLEDARLAFEARTASASSGTATTGDPAGKTLIDSVATFQTDGVAPGACIINFSDKSVATVTTVDSEIQITHVPLADGTENDWDAGDEYKIWNIVQCNVSGGNLVAVDSAGSPIDPIFPTPFTQIVRTASSSATLQEQTAIQYSSYNGGVTIDVISSYAGTEYPIGTPQQPVNNLNDALSIASNRGFTTFFVLGDLTVTTGHDCSGMIIVGESMSKSEITIDADADVTNAEFYDAYVVGTLDGDALLKNCRIKDLTYISGYIEQCILDPGTITLSGTNAHFLDCWSGIAGPGTPIIDLGGSGIGLALRNYNGGVKLQNKTGTESVSVDLNSGQIILDSTVTNGTVVIRGVGKLTDNSGGATVDASNFVTGDVGIASAVWEKDAADDMPADTFGALFQLVARIEGGRWRILDNQMVFYKEDNVTEVARFNLFDADGKPSQENVFERVRV